MPVFKKGFDPNEFSVEICGQNDSLQIGAIFVYNKVKEYSLIYNLLGKFVACVVYNKNHENVTKGLEFEYLEFKEQRLDSDYLFDEDELFIEVDDELEKEVKEIEDKLDQETNQKLKESDFEIEECNINESLNAQDDSEIEEYENDDELESEEDDELNYLSKDLINFNYLNNFN